MELKDEKKQGRKKRQFSSWHSAFISSYSHRSSSFLHNADIFSSCMKALRLIKNINCIESRTKWKQVVKIKDFEHFFKISFFFWHVFTTKENIYLHFLCQVLIYLKIRKGTKISLNFLNKSKRDTLSMNRWMKM
jgi:hypothetical protein